MSKIRSYRELEVWKISKNLVINIYKLTNCFPIEERFSLSDQMRRAAISIPSNIAEGQQRFSLKEYIRFLYISKGSTAEILTQLEMVRELYPDLNVETLLLEYNLLSRKLANLITSLKTVMANNKTHHTTHQSQPHSFWKMGVSAL